jgi:hypothetical protein
MSLPVSGVPLDSTNSRQHRGIIAAAVNSLIQRVFTPNAINTNVNAAGDASKTLTCKGGLLLVTGTINVAAAAATFTVTRGGSIVATFGNVAPGVTISFSFFG